MLILIFPTYLSVLYPSSNFNVVRAQGNGVQVVIIELNVQIDSGSSGLVSRGIQTAEAANAAAVIIEMNTPGGLLSDMISIIDAIGSSTVPVYTYVGNNSLAASAGSYIAMATKQIFMGPGSQIGPSTPIVVGGSPLEQNHTAGAALTLMEGLAEKNGRNVTAVYNMVVFDIAYTYDQALRFHVADRLSNSLSQTLTILNLSGATIVTVSESFSEQLVSLLSNPTVDGILLLLGIIAIVLDFLHPTILLSIAGAILIVLALIGEEAIQGPTPNPSFIALPIVLFALAAALIVFELKTGHGFFLFGGVVVGAIATLFLAYEIPYSPSPFGDLQYIEITVLIVAGALLAVYARWVGKTLRKKPVTGSEALIGKTGKAISDLSPEGEVAIEGIAWRARIISSDVRRISKGDNVIVTGISGLTLLIEPEAIKEKARLDSQNRNV